MSVQGSRLKVQGSRFRVQGSGFRDQGSGFRVQGSGFRVQVYRGKDVEFRDMIMIGSTDFTVYVLCSGLRLRVRV